MSGEPIAYRRGSAARRALEATARERRCVFVAGLSGVGKSLMVQQLALLARAAGRELHLLQWDVARRAFETPAILAAYPEVDGVTHVAIRRAAGLWAREAVRAWNERFREPAHLLIGETPLVGGRLVELVRPQEDGAEALLAGPATLFLVPAPSREVRAAIECARAGELISPRHEREAHNAAVALLRAHWLEVLGEARRRGLAPGGSDAYDPAVYTAVYAALLVHRTAEVVPVTEWLPVHGSPHVLAGVRTELVPDAVAVERMIAEAAAIPVERLEREAAAWFGSGG